MKSQQQNNQTGKQEQPLKQPSQNSNQSDLSQQRGNQEQPGRQQQPPGNEKSNISVNNEGKIGKAHEQWDSNNNNRNPQPGMNAGMNSGMSDQQKDKQVRSDKTVTEPEIDAPIYDPEKTEKKIPNMENKKK